MMTTNPRVWVLEIATFRGVSPGAMHSYATLRSPDPEPIPVEGRENAYYDLQGVKYAINMLLDEDQAQALNDLNLAMGRDHSTDHVVGEPSHQFWSDEAAERFGTFVWTKVCDTPGAVLFRGSGYGVNGPEKVLAGPPEAVAELGQIWEKWDKNESTTANDAAELMWDAAFRRLGLEEPPHPGGVTVSGAGAPERPRDRYAYVAERGDELVLVDPYECSCSHGEYQHGEARRGKNVGPCDQCSCKAFEAQTLDKPGDDF